MKALAAAVRKPRHSQMSLKARSRSALLRPPDKTCAQQARDFIWDKQKKTCLTRTPMNWCAVALYYSIFLGIVVLIFAVSLEISQVATDQRNGPQYILKDSPIGPTPTLNFFPLNASRNLIWLSPNRSYSDYVGIIDKEFEKYKKAQSNFDPASFEDCGTPPYGYDDQNPCIYFRMNRLIKWEPIPYHKGDRLPTVMPQIVKDLIRETDIPRVWLTCEGVTAKDRDHLPFANFQLKGDKGFDILGYPYERQEDYVDPVIAIKVKKPERLKVLVWVTCYPWARKMNRNKTSVEVCFYFE